MSSLHCPICFQEYIQYISIKAVHTYCLFILTFLQQVSLKMIVLKLTFEYYKPPTTKILISHGKNITHLHVILKFLLLGTVVIGILTIPLYTYASLHDSM